MLTGYCCRLFLKENVDEIVRCLDECIRKKDYDRGTKYINDLVLSDEIKQKILKCFLSYGYSC